MSKDWSNNLVIGGLTFLAGAAWANYYQDAAWAIFWIVLTLRLLAAACLGVKRWWDQGVCERMLRHFADDPDMDQGMIDSTIAAPILARPVPKKEVSGSRRRWDVVAVV